MYELKPQYYTGIEAIDEQHSKIFKLADDAYKLLKDENKLFKDEDLAAIVKGLQDYATYHFIEEESYMDKMGYEGISKQVEQHKWFLEEVNRLAEKLPEISLGNQDSLIEKTLERLTTWFQQHIETLDMQMK